MSRLNNGIAASLAVALLAGCAQNGAQQTTAGPNSVNASTAGTAATEDVAAIVVTGSRIERGDYESYSPIVTASNAKVGRMSAPPAPPPPPAPGVMMQRMASPSFPLRAEAWPGPYYKDFGRDKFTAVAENPFRAVKEDPVSTFSIDVDTASYSFVRASLNRNTLPQPASVRAEEMINYFPYDYASPTTAQQPFTTNVAVFPSPWTEGRKLVRIGIKGYTVQRQTRPKANLVFLIDTSGSMNEPNKLPLVKQSLSMLLEQLDGDDTVSIVTYAGYAGTALEPTPASQKAKIRAVIDRLGAGGGTAGAEGIRQAYTLAEQNLDPKGVNRVILATDGDFNIGITNQDELKGYVGRERGKGVFLSVLGFGMGNYNDALMQALAQNGNGAAAYIDTISEARKTLVEEASSTLFPIAKDVKIQVEFNPATVAEYRLIGYETRMLAREDFENDKVDAGDVGSGQTVTALYEVVPVGGPKALGDLRYAKPESPAQGLEAVVICHRTGGCTTSGPSTELGFVKIRYKQPKSDTSQLISTPINKTVEFARFEDAPQDARFATSVAAFAELLRGGKYSGSLGYDDVLKIATGARGEDGFGYRSEFIQMVRAAKTANSMARMDR